MIALEDWDIYNVDVKTAYLYGCQAWFTPEDKSPQS